MSKTLFVSFWLSEDGSSDASYYVVKHRIFSTDADSLSEELDSVFDRYSASFTSPCISHVNWYWYDDSTPLSRNYFYHSPKLFRHV